MPEINPPGDEPTSRLGGRPSLMSSAPGGPRQGSILQALERPGSRIPLPAQATRRGRRGWWLVVPMVAAAAMVGWSLWTPQVDLASTYAAAPADFEARPNVPEAQALPVAQPVAPVVDEASTAARIETLEAPVADPVPGREALHIVEPLPPEIRSPVASSPAPRSRPEKSVRTEETKPGRVTKTARAQDKLKSGEVPPRRSGGTAGGATPTAELSAKATSKGVAADPEVDIVDALMRRLDGEAVAAAPQSTGRPAIPARPAEGAHVAELAGTCRISNMADLLACKHQICRGRWGKTETCPTGDREAAERAASGKRGQD